MANKKSTSGSVKTLKYAATRKNIPPAGLEAQGVLKEVPKVRYEYNPHLPPALRSAKDATEADRLPELLMTARQRALSADEAGVLAEALKRHEPWLEWSGKREKPWFAVDPVALHMHERVSAQAILRVLARDDIERDLFADPQQDYAQAVQFYKYDVDWANRMILGDSLQVMASLSHREDLAGKVQMIYIDPPYGIKFSSNFQPKLGQRDVKDREQDLTREPEMVKAYRDTWTLGIHSYLAYLRDRLSIAKELLAKTGSIFVQISDANLHRIRCLMDEVFEADNFVGQITFKKTGGFETAGLPSICDYLIWYAKDKSQAKLISLYDEKVHGEGSGDRYNSVMLENGSVVPISQFKTDNGFEIPVGARLFLGGPLTSDGAAKEPRPFEFEGVTFLPKPNQHWKSTIEGLTRVGESERIFRTADFLNSRIFLNDFAATPVTNIWTDTMGTAEREKIYVVQTATRIVERCILMTTDPGDLVLDPTCGSGTTAYVAEQWGRRWITCDSSRVALALAKHRLLTAEFEFYRLRELTAEDIQRNPQGTWIAEVGEDGKATGRRLTFKCKTLPHITLKSIARNASLDPIFAKHELLLTERLGSLNDELARVEVNLKDVLVQKLITKHREKGANAVTDGDVRRWLLPDTPPSLIKVIPAKKPLKGVTPKQVEAYRADIPKPAWKEWQVPFDTDSDWPKPLQDALIAYRSAWRAKMDEINSCIGANAEVEELVDKPEFVKGIVRVSGPFTMEGVISIEQGPETPIGGAPEELETFDGDVAVANAEAHLDKIIRLLKASGVDFQGNKNMKFSRLDPISGASLVHAEGNWLNGDNQERRVVVSVGPETGNISAFQVEEVIRNANRKGYDDVVFAGFGFDAAAQDAIQSGTHPKLRLHMALIRPDVAMGDLLKTQPGSQLFTVFSAPRVNGPIQQPDNTYRVEVEGMDVYDPVSNTLFPTDKDRIAAWFLDTDYDGRTFCICQAFFPDKSKWSKLAKALEDTDVIPEDAFEALSGLISLPFARPERIKKGESWRVAVKLIDPRGNEGLRVLTID